MLFSSEKILFYIAMALASSGPAMVNAGPIAYGICETGCNALAVAWYAAVGCIFGTVAALVAPCAAIVAYLLSNVRHCCAASMHPRLEL